MRESSDLKSKPVLIGLITIMMVKKGKAMEKESPTEETVEPPPAPARKSKLPKIVIVFALLAVIFMGISTVLPWHTINNKSTEIHSHTGL